jgi:hypothetical protein
MAAAQDFELTVADGCIARFRFSGSACWVEISRIHDEFAPRETTFSDSLSPAVGRAMIARALDGASVFEACGHPVTSCRCAAHEQVRAAQARRKPKFTRTVPEAQYVAGAVETDFGASPVPVVDEWPTSRVIRMAMDGPKWWFARPNNIDHPLLRK